MLQLYNVNRLCDVIKGFSNSVKEEKVSKKSLLVILFHCNICVQMMQDFFLFYLLLITANVFFLYLYVPEIFFPASDEWLSVPAGISNPSAC